MGILTTGPAVKKNTSHQKWQEDWLQHVELCAIRGPWFINEFLYNAHTPTSSSSSSQDPTSSSQDSVFDVSRHTESAVPERSGSTSEELRGNPLHKPTFTENKNKNESREEVQSHLVHDLPDWLQEFRENLVDERCPTEPRGNPAPKDRDTSSSSNELPMESRAKVDPGSGKHSVYTNFPKHPTCDICLKRKITRSSCRRRTGTVLPRAENFYWLNYCGSQSPLRRMWVSTKSSIRCGGRLSGYNRTHAKQNLHRKPRRAYRSSWSRRGNQKSFRLTIPWNLASLVRN